ncbi:Uncharacterized protein family (UPF0236) [Thermobacillus composti KWC4]|uniref:Uncharacterized protein family (UPF0236) n=1 Tax=Thermobacillus composti (strain DSM 18247 / JCM 13945 / KWC4) TaxID=717605 RepID=L0ECE6_THECK|nr:ISLre2-like element ISTco3 family transposase [Thermobacillus composti]AGA57472.1 Uncharacterized protein family (UPF0236) [Thermobacillus composti KWC4]
MQHFTTAIPAMKELEEWMFRKMQDMFVDAMRSTLEMLDQIILEQRDRERYRVKAERETSVNTVFGNIRFKRRLYMDRQTGKHVYLLDQHMRFEGRGKVSPHLLETAIAFAAEGPSYRDSARRLEQLLGYAVLSHEAIRGKLIEQAEKPVKATEKRPAKVLFVEADGLYTKLQRRKRKGMEHAIAVVHEGWEQVGKRVRLRNKQHDLHRGEGDFWEAFGDFLTERYEIDGDTWLVVGGDGAKWIGECESYFHKCIYTLDRFHVARDLKRFVGHLPKVWKEARQALARQNPADLMAAVERVPIEAIAPDKREEWTAYQSFLRRHRKHLEDYRKTLEAHGIDTRGMRPMGSAEAQMRVLAKRTKRGGYSWSERGCRAMLETVMRRRQIGRLEEAEEHAVESPQRVVSVRRLLHDAIRPAKGYVDGMIRLLRSQWQSRPTGMALKGLRGY